MLQRTVSPEGVTYYVSPLLRAAGIPHAFSTRVGGISASPFNSLNLGNPGGCDVQDDYQNIWANYRRLQAAIDCADRDLCRVHQVHGHAVARVRRGEVFDTAIKADVLVGDDPARILSVRVADCVPVLIATEDGRAVVAAHAGWRGVVGGAVDAAVSALGEIAGDKRLLAAIGPSIGPGAFEVGPEVLAEFDRAFGEKAAIRRRADGKGNIDLRETLRRQLLKLGLADAQIDTTDRCTHRDADEFFSHRRENGITGRMAALISPAT